MAKPTDDLSWASGTVPVGAQLTDGYQEGEMPAPAITNWIWNLIYLWFAWADFVFDDAGLTYADRAQWFGLGVDGDVTIASGTTTLTKDAFYNNLTISGTGKIAAAGHRVFVAGTLDLTAAPAGAINNDGNAGGNASGATGGSVAAAAAGGAFIGAGVGASGIGRTATTGAGTTGGASTAGSTLWGGCAAGVAGGAGGAGSNAGGTANSPGGDSTSFASPKFPKHITHAVNPSTTLVQVNSGGYGGSSGGGDGTNAGGGGGGGGGNAGGLVVAAHTLVTGTSTPAGVIRCNGGNGGNGGTPSAGNTGGGGGGAGGGGGWVQLLVSVREGGSVANGVQANGGAGGAGGNGHGSPGGGGYGGYGNNGGGVLYVRFDNSTLTWVDGDTGNSGTAWGTPSGATGGSGGAGVTAQTTL